MLFEQIKTAVVFVTLCVPFLLLTLWAVVDAAGREFATFGRKVAWICVAAIPFVGFIVYLIFGRRQGSKEGTL